MLNIGRARWFLTIQEPISGVDSLGAPTVTWTDYATAYGEIENEQVDQSETTQAGPRRELSRTATFVIRCHPLQMFTPAMRVIGPSNSIYEITAARYNERRDTAYLDVTGGISSGGIP